MKQLKEKYEKERNEANSLLEIIVKEKDNALKEKELMISKLQQTIKELNPKFVEEIKIEKIERGKKIGEGGYGIVYGGKLKENNLLIALKQLKIGDQLTPKIQESFKREIEIMKKLKHPNITQLIGRCKLEDGNEIMVLEYMNRSSLYHQLHEKSIQIPLWLQIKLGMDIMKGINYLHHLNPKVMHRDLKSHK